MFRDVQTSRSITFREQQTLSGITCLENNKTLRGITCLETNKL